MVAPVEKVPEFQEIVHSKRRPVGGDALERILRDYVGHVGQQRLKLPARVVIEHPILTPGELPRNQFVLSTAKRMKRMGYPKSLYGGSHTNCIR